ncbi:hypothetical protein EDC04DRAFT_2815551 [Pisolithus marmoratus]|nr:hypothetical protein EDC04DRAFT_2815551 [Pisolithus marmoratus]
MDGDGGHPMEVGVGMNVMLAIDVDGTIVVLVTVLIVASGGGRHGTFATRDLLIFGIGSGLITTFFTGFLLAIVIKDFFTPGRGTCRVVVNGTLIDIDVKCAYTTQHIQRLGLRRWSRISTGSSKGTCSR